MSPTLGAAHRCLCGTATFSTMGIMKKAGLLGVAKKVYSEARKPHNQAKINQVVQMVKERRNQARAR